MKKIKLKYKHKHCGVYEVLREETGGALFETGFFIIRERANWLDSYKIRYAYIANTDTIEIGVGRKSISGAMSEIRKYIKEHNMTEIV